MSSTSIHHYVTSNDHILEARAEVQIAQDLSEYLYEDYLFKLRYDNSAHTRMRAIDKVIEYGSKRNCISALLNTIQIDENPNVRVMARKKLKDLIQE